LVVIVLQCLIIGCTPNLSETQLRQEAAQQVDHVCGDLKDQDSYPLSQQCIDLFGKLRPSCSGKAI
jgi:hypothetical protein